jgi:hypothetical protein
MIWPLSLLTKPRPDRNAASVFIAISQLTAKVTSMNNSVEELKAKLGLLEGNLQKAVGLLNDQKSKLDAALANGISEDDIKSISEQLGKDNEALAAEIAAIAPVAPAATDASSDTAAAAQ